MEVSSGEKNSYCESQKRHIETFIDNEENRSESSLSIRDLVELPEPRELLSVSAVLYYCKCKILRPYLRILALMGLRPLHIGELSSCVELLWLLYTAQAVLFIICGYILQFMACFRRDRGFCYETKPQYFYFPTDNKTDMYKCNESIIFSFAVPSIVHFGTYIYAVYLFRDNNSENLSSLMERVFLSSSNPSDGSISQKKLVRTLWIFISISIIWMVLSFISVNFMMAATDIKFKWINNESHFILIVMKVLLTICTLWHDMIQATIITSYCLQVKLLTSYLYFLRVKLILTPIRPIEWMKELLEFKKLLKHLNNALSPAVCMYMIISISWALSGIIWLLKYDNINMIGLPTIGISILNIVLWLLISLAPIVLAAKLTSACRMIQGAGHEVRTRPFAHQETPNSELDSALLYASSLRLHAKLFGIPISSKYIYIFITISAIALLTLGQCHFIEMK